MIKPITQATFLQKIQPAQARAVMPEGDDGELFNLDAEPVVDEEGSVGEDTGSKFIGVPFKPGNVGGNAYEPVSPAEIPRGYRTAADAKASLTGFPKDLVDTYYDVVEENGVYNVKPKDGVTIDRSENYFMKDYKTRGSDGTLFITFQRTRSIVYNIKNSDGTSVKIINTSYQQNERSSRYVDNGTAVIYYDKIGRRISNLE